MMSSPKSMSSSEDCVARAARSVALAQYWRRQGSGIVTDSVCFDADLGMVRPQDLHLGATAALDPLCWQGRSCGSRPRPLVESLYSRLSENLK